MKRFTKVLAGLSWRRNNAELVHQTKLVIVGPLFEGLAVHDTGNENPWHRYPFACRWNTHEVALVSATKGLMNHDLVLISEHLLNRETGIREGDEVQRDPLFIGFQALNGRRGIVKREVRGHQFIEGGAVSLIERVIGTTCECLVLFGGHVIVSFLCVVWFLSTGQVFSLGALPLRSGDVRRGSDNHDAGMSRM